MFEPGFEARVLCGGFSGSAVVVVVRPVAGVPVVVKLGKASNVKDEAERTKRLMDLACSNAPNLLGDPVICGEDGGLPLELVGSCYTVPELQKGNDLINTLQELITHLNRSALFPSSVVPGDEPFGSMKIVLDVLLGSGGILSKLTNPPKNLAAWRRGTTTLPELWEMSKRMAECTAVSSDQKSKPALHNFFHGTLSEAARNLYDKLANLSQGRMWSRQNLQNMLIKLDDVLRSCTHSLPLVGIAHGDLHCANLILDPADGIWIIDPAQLTLDDAAPFRDYAKLETC